MSEQLLAIVGIGVAGMPVIEKAKEMGVRTLGFGMADSLGKDLVDIFEEVSIFDIDGMYEACRRHHVTGVIGPSEISTEPAAYLADRLGLPGNSVKGGFCARNKYRMRQRVAALKTVRQPAFALYQEGMDLAFPVVVKAVDSCGKQGVSLVRNQEELHAAVAEARKISSDGSALVEEYLEGVREFSVECLASGDIVTVVQVTDKDSSGPPHFAETGHHQPANISADLRRRMELAAREILNALGIRCGMAHLELKVCREELYFIEVGARGGGSHIADILTSNSTDCDYCKAAIECCFGTYVQQPVKNVAFTGIYYHCLQNKALDQLFAKAENAEWTIAYTGEENFYPDVSYNEDRVRAGYLIYRADHKIGIRDALEIDALQVERINDLPNAFALLWNHNREIGREIPDEELKAGIEKFLQYGDELAILDGNHIIAYLNLYCNNAETRSAYISNVYVLQAYRGLGLSKRLMERALDICRERAFLQATLHVLEDNTPAVACYQTFGFRFTERLNEHGRREMVCKFL